jgi:integrase
LPKWLAEIERARSGNDLATEAGFWRKRHAAASSDGERRAIEDLIIDRGVERLGLISHREAEEPGFEEEREELGRFVRLATGDAVPFLEHLDEYMATSESEATAKTLHMKRRNLENFGTVFANVADVDSEKLQRWINAKAAKKAARATIHRAIGDLRGYWKFLVSLKAATDKPGMFDSLTMAGTKRGKKKPYPPAALVVMEAAARKRGDGQLADFVLIDMYTGARAEEIATLKSSHINLAKRSIAMPGTKTDAAERVVPIHDKLLPTLRRLVKGADKDGYLFHGLKADKFGDRYKPLTKRFTTLKNGQGYGEDYDFHSIRRTVITMFEDAGVAENVVAHIVGHQLRTMSYGLYSGGPSLATKAAAMALLKYPKA